MVLLSQLHAFLVSLASLIQIHLLSAPYVCVSLSLFVAINFLPPPLHPFSSPLYFFNVTFDQTLFSSFFYVFRLYAVLSLSLSLFRLTSLPFPYFFCTNGSPSLCARAHFPNLRSTKVRQWRLLFLMCLPNNNGCRWPASCPSSTHTHTYLESLQ